MSATVSLENISPLTEASQSELQISPIVSNYTDQDFIQDSIFFDGISLEPISDFYIYDFISKHHKQLRVPNNEDIFGFQRNQTKLIIPMDSMYHVKKIQTYGKAFEQALDQLNKAFRGPNPLTKPPPFQVKTLVEMTKLFHHVEMPYVARIKAINADGTFTIQFLAGKEEQNVPVDYISPLRHSYRVFFALPAKIQRELLGLSNDELVQFRLRHIDHQIYFINISLMQWNLSARYLPRYKAYLDRKADYKNAVRLEKTLERGTRRGQEKLAQAQVKFARTYFTNTNKRPKGQFAQAYRSYNKTKRRTQKRTKIHTA